MSERAPPPARDAPALAWLGDGAVRVALPAGATPTAVWTALRALAGVRDVVVAERHACAYLDARELAPPERIEARIAAALAALPSSAAAPDATAREPVTIRARYDGPDLARVADTTGLSVEQVVALHAGATYAVRFVGFLPGFAYLGELDPRIAVARLPAPRARVPAGAVGIAGARTGVYPCASPGGWNLVATAVDFVAFDPARGARLLLGDRVRFERV